MHHDCSHDCLLNSRFTFGPYLFYTEKFVTQFKTTELNINANPPCFQCVRARTRGNDAINYAQ